MPIIFDTLAGITNPQCILCGREHSWTIGELIARDPIVHASMMLHFRGALSYEEALITAIAHLVETNRSLTESLTQYCKPFIAK